MNPIEGHNAHTFLLAVNDRGVIYVQEHSLPAVPCSDAHSALELGNTYNDVPEFDLTPQGLVQAVKQGRMAGKRPNQALLMAPAYATPRQVLG